MKQLYKDDRSFWSYLILSVLTLGVYRIYFWYRYTEDINALCEGDGKESKNYIFCWALSMITLGLYGIYWRCRQADRLYTEGPLRYGIRIKESGSFLLAWLLFGYLTAGITFLAADYFLIVNLNRAAERSNEILTGLA